jgi:type IV pilus assembly protein PilM
MNFLPKASGTRPRVACEIMPHGVVAARSADAASPLAAVARVALAEGAVSPSLKPGNIVDRVAVTAAIRGALEQVGERANSRDGNLTLVIPDSAVRVLLLDFEALPSRVAEALPLVRFRLKKLLPFDADEAMVAYQAMSTSKSIVRVLAVAIPRDVLSEYETAAREAGFEPGAVLPSTLACLAALDDAEPALLLNANQVGVTAAIVRNGVLLLHRSVDLQERALPVLAEVLPEVLPLAGLPIIAGLPIVDVHETAEEWAAQQPLPEHGRNPYADQMADEAAVQGVDDITGMNVPDAYAAGDANIGASDLQPVPLSAEIAQAVSVAAAYFEDTLAIAPTEVLSAGSLGAERLRQILKTSGVGDEDGLQVRELVETAALLPDAVSASTPRAWLSGVLGALRG